MCKFRKKDGHVIKNCPDPRCKDAKVPTFTKPMASININEARKGQDNILRVFRSTGTVSLNSNTKKYNIVRDTTSAKTVIAREAFPDIDSTIPFNLAEECLESNLVKGSVIVGISDSGMPIPNATLPLGNDLARTLVAPKLKTACVVTRAQAKQGSTKRDNPSTVSSPTFSPANCPNLLSDQMALENPIVTQHNDTTLVKFRNEAVSEKKKQTNPPLFITQTVC